MTDLVDLCTCTTSANAIPVFILKSATMSVMASSVSSTPYVVRLGTGTALVLVPTWKKPKSVTSSPSLWCMLRFVKPNISLSFSCVGLGGFSEFYASVSSLSTSASTNPCFLLVFLAYWKPGSSSSLFQIRICSQRGNVC